MTDFKDAIVIITGASGGFGQQLTRQCLMAGSKLILADIDLPRLETVADTICREVGQGDILQCIGSDLSTAAGCDTLYKSVKHAPDILINNAGIGMFGRFDETPDDRWETLIQVNLLAAMRLVHRFVPGMIERRRGHLVHITSIAGWVGSLGLAAYTASKYGLRGFGESLMEELAPYSVRVSNVYPFFSRTPILDSPRYGTLENAGVPDAMLSDPADVIREVLKGVQQNRQHVFPDPTARRLHWIKRLAPGLLPILSRRLGSNGAKSEGQNGH